MQEKQSTGTRKRGPAMDKEAVKDGLLTVAAHYAGPGKQGGVRVLFRCPGCGKTDKFAANPSRGIVGCLNGNCPVPKVMDALDVVAHFERLNLSRDWSRVLAKGYEILGLLPADAPKRAPRKQNGAASPTVPKDGSGGENEAPPRASRAGPRGQAPEDPAIRAEDLPETLSGPPALRIPEPAKEGADGEQDSAGYARETRTSGRAAGEDAASGDHPKSSSWTVGGGFGEASEVAVVEDLITVEPEDDEPIEDAEVVGIDEQSGGKIFGLPRDRTQDPRDHAPGSPGLLNAVYRDVLDSCPLDPDHLEYLKRRGLSHATVRTARLGSMNKKRAKRLREELPKRYGKDLLLSVPGFSEHPETQGLRFTLSFDCILIPYHDADLNVTSLEGRYMGAGPPPKTLGKYVSLREGGNHVYVFPDHLPERLEAFCEGVMGALVAAENGIAVGSIQGFRRYRSSPGSKTDGDVDGGPLLEIDGADFRGRRVPYIPDVDDPPQPEVIGEAPAAARHLVGLQNGEPAIALLPSGKDLDEWLLSMLRSERRAAFTGLVGGSVDLETFEASLRQEDAKTTRGRDETRQTRGAESPVTNDKGAVGKPRDTTSPPLEDGRREPEGRRVAAPRDVPTGDRRRRLLDAAYGALLEEPTDEHLRFWDALGVSGRTVREGRFGSVSVRGTKPAIEDLVERFGADALLSVPGFGTTGAGKIVFALAGGAALVPYRDGDGLITGLAAFPVETEPDAHGQRAGGPKPVLPKSAEDHLYVHPRFDPSGLVAVCESPLQAILAAEAGFAVGAIAGPGRHRVPGAGGTLPELRGVGFGGRRILYVPSLGDGEDERRSIASSLAAAEALVARHNGVPVFTPQTFPGGFGRWLLGRPEAMREADLSELLEDADSLEDAEASALTPAEQGKRKASRNKERNRRARTKKDEEQDREGGEEGGGDPKGEAVFVRSAARIGLPSNALVTPGEALLSALGALLAFWLAGRVAAAFPEAYAGYLSRMPDWGNTPSEAALILAGLVALWLWSQRSSIRRKRRRLRQGRIDH